MFNDKYNINNNLNKNFNNINNLNNSDYNAGMDDDEVHNVLPDDYLPKSSNKK